MTATAIYVITGSRAWEGDPEVIRRSLVAFGEAHPDRHLVLYHGDCPHGRHGRSVDRLARDFARQLGWHVEDFPADWYRGGTRKTVDPSAGPDRNERMVAKAANERWVFGAVVEVHAYPSDSSRGTWDCWRRAQRWCFPGTVHREGTTSQGKKPQAR